MSYVFKKYSLSESSTTMNSTVNILDVLAKFIQSDKNINILFSSENKINFLDLTIEPFSISNEEHLKLLNSVLGNFRFDLEKVQTIDIKLILSISFGLISLALVPVSMGFTSILTAAAFVYVGYLFKAREHAYDEYSTILQDMTNVYIWTMSDERSEITEGSLQTLKPIQEQLHKKIKLMHEFVNPLLSDHNIQKYTKKIVNEALNSKLSTNDETCVSNKAELSSSYLLYGQHNASKFQISQGFFEFSRRSTVNMIYKTACFFSFNTQNNDNKVDQQEFNSETCTV